MKKLTILASLIGISFAAQANTIVTALSGTDVSGCVDTCVTWSAPIATPIAGTATIDFTTTLNADVVAATSSGGLTTSTGSGPGFSTPTLPVPDVAATAALLLFGMGALEIIRRRFVVARAKA
ncbi:MAG: VPDSG-CTERM sorting domain-containing protein [Verrucomicrobiae bacterium]|nr:VPDSG-CTERM sorting domain-containing protein [Verrucomicrobiae bacterium]